MELNHEEILDQEIKKHPVPRAYSSIAMNKHAALSAMQEVESQWRQKAEDLRAEMAARMPGLGDGSYMDETINMLAGYKYNGSDRIKKLKWWTDADAAYKVMQADALISAINKTAPATVTGEK